MREGCIFATLIFHIRWWLARRGFASHALGYWLRTGCARSYEAGEPSPNERHHSRRALNGCGNPADCGPMDPDRRDLRSTDRNLEDVYATWR
jgi:hypothetical protein